MYALSLLYLYLIIYRERTEASREGKSKGTDDEKEREPGQRLDCLPSFPPRPRSIPSGGDVGQRKRPTRKRENQGEGCRRPLRPFLTSPFAPSDVFTVHTIASRSPPHPLATSHRVREGRPPRPVQCDAIATHRHHIAIDQQPQGIASTFCHPPRLVLFPVSPPPSGGEGRAASQPGRASRCRSPRRPSRPSSAMWKAYCRDNKKRLEGEAT